LSRDQRERLAQAERLAAGTLAERRQAADMVRVIEREIAEARDAEETEAAIEKALQRARRAGEAFEVETVDVGEWRRNEDGSLARRNGQLVLDVQTVRRVSRTDGLASLYKAGSIDDRAKRLGDVFRVLWDRAKPPMAVSDYGPKAGGGRCDTGKMLVEVALSGSAGVVIGEIARRVSDDRTFRVLAAVAGQGLTIRSLGSGGDAKAANRERLLAALDTVEAVLSEPKWKSLASQAR
jgi:tRNA(Ser,Leu) C12 N-acetylase TAN1